MAGRLEISQFLTAIGDGTGPFEAVGNYSIVPVNYKIIQQAALGIFANRPEGNTVLYLQSLTIFIGDVGNASSLTPSGYGANPAPLANGVSLEIRGAGDVLLRNLTAGDAVTTNGGWQSIAGNQEQFVWLGAATGANALTYTYDLTQLVPGGVALNVTEGEYLTALLNDDFTFLTNHRFFVRGYVGGQSF